MEASTSGEFLTKAFYLALDGPQPRSSSGLVWLGMAPPRGEALLAEVLTFLEVVRTLAGSIQDRLIVESGSSKAISWVTNNIHHGGSTSFGEIKLLLPHQ